MASWINAIIIDSNGEKQYHQFDNEDELRFFLACNEDCKLEKAEYYEE